DLRPLRLPRRAEQGQRQQHQGVLPEERLAAEPVGAVCLSRSRVGASPPAPSCLPLGGHPSDPPPNGTAGAASLWQSCPNIPDRLGKPAKITVNATRGLCRTGPSRRPGAPAVRRERLCPPARPFSRRACRGALPTAPPPTSARPSRCSRRSAA